MRLRFAARDIPVRLVTGAYIAHSGLEEWRGSAEQAEGLHGMAANAFPVLKPIPPRTPTMREPGSIWPSRTGIAVSKDVWMLGMGLGLLVSGARRRGVSKPSLRPSRTA